MEGHTGKLARLRFSPDGSRIASASWEDSEKPVIIWDAEQGKELSALDGLKYGVWGVSWSPDGSKLATAAYGHSKAEIWHVDSGEKLKSFSGSQARFSECSWSPDGRRLSSASYDGSIHIWEVVKERPAPEFVGHQQRVRTLAWSHDGARIATASSDGTVALVLTDVAAPVAITPERRDRLLQLLEEKAPKDEDMKRRLTAALHCRAGDIEQAAELLDQGKGRGGAVGQLLAAIVQHQLGSQDQAKKQYDAIAGWIQGKEEEEEGPAVPANQNWHNWAIYKILQREAAVLIADPAKPPLENGTAPPDASADNDASSAGQSEGERGG